MRTSMPHLAVTAAFALLCATSGSAAGDTEFVQITDDTAEDCGSFMPSAGAAGAVVVFESTCDLAGDNEDGNREIFRFSSNQIIQITDSADCSNTSPVVNGTGTRIAFESDCNLTGTNADGNIEIFLWKQGAAGTVQLTTSTFCDNLSPTITAANSNAIVAFDSNCPTHPGNQDGSSEIFRVTEAGVITRLTDDFPDGEVPDHSGECDSINPSGNANGTLYAFESDCDLAGTNPDFAIEIFTVGSNAVVQQITRGGDDACSSLSPSIDETGSFIAFESDCDFEGDNGDGSVEIFRVQATTDGDVVQLTDDSGSSSCASVQPVIAGGGAFVAFSSFCNLVGGNSDRSLEAFRVAAAGGEEPVQLTSGGGCSSLVSAIDATGTKVFLDSDCDHAGDNDDGNNEIFSASPVIECVCGAPVSGASSPVASDALAILRGAVGARDCPLCACDTDASGTVVAQDALRTLRKAVGADIDLICPAA
ncbi:MAG TPA: hypothetical protein VEC57_03465 [Candidatus Limnocylindrales bacterium]|nr:hypothetical protein [Candidatus Limnocylindrales bacterium]